MHPRSPLRKTRSSSQPVRIQKSSAQQQKRKSPPRKPTKGRQRTPHGKRAAQSAAAKRAALNATAHETRSNRRHRRQSHGEQQPQQRAPREQHSGSKDEHDREFATSKLSVGQCSGLRR